MKLRRRETSCHKLLLLDPILPSFLQIVHHWWCVSPSKAWVPCVVDYCRGRWSWPVASSRANTKTHTIAIPVAEKRLGLHAERNLVGLGQGWKDCSGLHSVVGTENGVCHRQDPSWTSASRRHTEQRYGTVCLANATPLVKIVSKHLKRKKKVSDSTTTS